MRLNGHGALTLEDARTWIEETGLCLFLPRRQFSAGIAPSFVEAIAGERNPNPGARQIALAEELLVRLETDGIAVRLNLLGQPGEQPDFVVAAWVLPYVYALRGDRDWRRSPQLTGSRQVSPLAIQTYKLLETGDATIPQLKHALGREVTESAVLRAITELWQQLRIIPVISAPGKTAQWQLLRHRFQKAIAEGASTSQVTAISVLASIYLQAVIAASMEEVEIFLSPLTARSKIREVLRGLVATRQVHTISFGHAPHFYVAGTLPEFSVAPTTYASSAMAASSYFSSARSIFDEPHDRAAHAPAPPVANFAARIPAPAPSAPTASPAPAPNGTSLPRLAAEAHTPRVSTPRTPASTARPNGVRPHFSRTAAHARDRKPVQSANGRHARRTSRDARSSSGLRHGSGTRWAPSANGKSKPNGARKVKPASQLRAARNGHNGNHQNGSGHSANGHHGNGKHPLKTGAGVSVRNGSARKDARRPESRRPESRRPESRRIDARSKRKPALAAGAKAQNSKRYGFRASSGQRTKKRG
jgi:23S rRNA pseudouridine2605 synthase